MRARRFGVLMLVGSLLATACSGDDDGAPPADDRSSASSSAPVAAESTRTTPAPTIGNPTSQAPAPVTSAPVPTRDFTEVATIVREFIDDRDLNGAGLVIVERDDGVVYHEHWGEFDEDRISFVASSSKMITAGVLLHLDDQGLLDIDAPVADVVSWGDANPDITPAQLVSNSSGLVDLFDGLALDGYRCQYLPVGTLQQCAEQIFTTDADDDEVVPPDTEYRYGGAQWQVAGAVAEIASGKSWAELIDEIYVEPCGLETLGYNNHFAQIGPGGFDYPTDFDGDLSLLAATDNPNMEAGVYTTTGDYARLLLMHLRDGRCGDEQVLSPAALGRLHGDRILEAYGGSVAPGTGYGMGWWIDRETGRLTDPGAYGSVPWLDLDDGYGGFLVIEADSIVGFELAGLLFDAVDAAMTSPE